MDVDTGLPAAPAHDTRDRSRPVIGATLLVAAAFSAYVLRVGGVCCGIVARDLYDYGTWLLVVGLSVAAGVLLVSRTSSVRVPTAAVAGVLGAQLAGTGVVAIRRWVPVGGFGHGKWDNIGQLHVVSGLLALCGLGAVVACLVSLHAEGALPAPVLWRVRGVAVGAGLVVVVALPVVVAGGQSDVLDLTSLGAHALVYSFPFGISLVLTGWLSRPAAIGAGLAVLASALVLAHTNRALVNTPAPVAGLVLVMLASALVLLTRAVPRSGGTATS